RTFRRPINPAGADHRSARGLGQSLNRIVSGDDFERKAMLSREHSREIVIEAGTLIIGAAEPGDCSLTEEYDKIVPRPRWRQWRRRSGRGTARGQRDRS